MNQIQQTTDAAEVVNPIDGRTLRRTRNRTAVITALLDMIREGDLHPAAADIADRAGVSHRSIFRYFDDLDDLVHTAIDQALLDANPLSAIPAIGIGPLDARVPAFVSARIALFESVDGAMQLARTRAHSIPSIDEELAAIALVFKDQIAVHFAAELAYYGEAERDRVVDAVLVLTSYDSFTIHLRLLHHDVDRIRAGWTTALGALLGS